MKRGASDVGEEARKLRDDAGAGLQAEVRAVGAGEGLEEAEVQLEELLERALVGLASKAYEGLKAKVKGRRCGQSGHATVS